LPRNHYSYPAIAEHFTEYHLGKNGCTFLWDARQWPFFLFVMNSVKLVKEELVFKEKNSHPLFKDLEGRVFGRLTVLGYAGFDKRTQWYCECECKNIIVRDGCLLLKGVTSSCGCFRRDKTSEKSTTHGHANRGRTSDIYRTWLRMKSRCYNKRNKDYHHYGGRGIIICERWMFFPNFYNDMGDKPSGLSIERIDNNGNYEPGNCRWATQKEQCNNQRTNRILEFNGMSKTTSQWADELGIKSVIISKRLFNGWTVERTLTQPLRKSPTSLG